VAGSETEDLGSLRGCQACGLCLHGPHCTGSRGPAPLPGSVESQLARCTRIASEVRDVP
jgi:hypothetical protein